MKFSGTGHYGPSQELRLENLNPTTRRHMLAEFDADQAAGRIYLSKRFTFGGEAAFPALLRSALASGTPRTLEEALSSPGIFMPSAPINASQVLAEGEFNRFYIRGVCLRAIGEGLEYVVVYRAKMVREPRWSSEVLIGSAVHPERLLEDLRRNPGRKTELGIPGGPNSGISVRLAR